MSDYLQLNGRRALVTGGTQGIGAAVVARLRAAGAIVLTTARSTPADLTHADLFVSADVAAPRAVRPWPVRFMTASAVLISSCMSLGDRRHPQAALRCWTMISGSERSTRTCFRR